MTGLEELELARRAIMPHLHRTPIWRSEFLSRLVRCEVYLKAELFQKTGSYKPRGMLWAVSQLPPAAAHRGAITFSAGNAAQGLAYAGTMLGVPTTVVMPATASPTKAQATRDYGGRVVLFGTPQECLAHCQDLAEREQLTLISSYDDDNLMTGHASLGLEILDDLPDVQAVFVGIGGGGMAGGLVKALSARASSAELYGVEPIGAPAMHASLQAGHAVKLDKVATVADGLAAPTAGARCHKLIAERISDIYLVDDPSIIDAMRLLMTRAKLFAEPAGSAALAGLLTRAGCFAPTDKVVCIVSGGNMDLERLRPLL